MGRVRIAIPLVVVLVACRPASLASTKGAPPLDDGQIAEIAQAIDFQQTQTGQLATRRASDPDVRALAEELLADSHEEQRAERRHLAQTRTSPEASMLAGRFESAARDDRAWLSNEGGSRFDRDFLGSEIKEQTRQLDWFDHILVPAAHDDGLHSELLRRRAVAARLLEEAKQLVLRFPAPP